MFATILFTVNANAQLDKVNKTIDDINQTKKTVDKLKDLFPKKAKHDTSKTVAADTRKVVSNITVVTITGIEYAKLKTLNENIKACSGVQSTVLKYSSEMSTIEVTHLNNTATLLKLMGETSTDIFTEKDIDAVDEGKIGLKLKKS